MHTHRQHRKIRVGKRVRLYCDARASKPTMSIRSLSDSHSPSVLPAWPYFIWECCCLSLAHLKIMTVIHWDREQAGCRHELGELRFISMFGQCWNVMSLFNRAFCLLILALAALFQHKDIHLYREYLLLPLWCKKFMSNQPILTLKHKDQVVNSSIQGQ